MANEVRPEKLSLRYNKDRPYTDDLQALIHRSPDLKECKINIHNDAKLGASFLRALQDLKCCQLDVRTYGAEIELVEITEAINNRPKNPDQPKISIAIFF